MGNLYMVIQFMCQTETFADMDFKVALTAAAGILGSRKWQKNAVWVQCVTIKFTILNVN